MLPHTRRTFFLPAAGGTERIFLFDIVLLLLLLRNNTKKLTTDAKKIMPYKFSGASRKYRTAGAKISLPPVEDDPHKTMQKKFKDVLARPQDDAFDAAVISDLAAYQTKGLIIPVVEEGEQERRKAFENGVAEESVLEAYQHIAPRAAIEKMRAHRYLRYAEAGLEDVIVKFETFDDLIDYLRCECGLEMDYSDPGINATAAGDEMKMRFVSHAVQKSELEQAALGAEEPKLPRFFTGNTKDFFASATLSSTIEKEATSIPEESKCLKDLFQTQTDEEMCAVLEDYAKIVVFIGEEDECKVIKGWRLYYGE